MSAARRPRCCALIGLVLVAGSVVCPSGQSEPGAAPVAPQAATPAAAPVALLPAQVRWTHDLDAPPAGPGARDDERLYLALQDGTVRAFSLDTGTPAWSVEALTTWPLAAAGDAVYVLTARTVHVLDGADGRTRRTIDLPAAPTGPMTVTGDLVIVPVAPAMLIAWNITSGAEVWRLALPAPAIVPMTVAGGRLIAPLSNGQLTAVALRDGERLWTRPLRGTLTSAGTTGGLVIVGSDDRHVYAVDLVRGDLAWASRAWAPVVAVTADARQVYVASLDNIVRALDPANGNQRWRRVLGTRPSGRLQLVDGTTLLVEGLDPVLTALDASRGHIVSTYAFADDADLQVSAAASLVLTPVRREATSLVLFTRTLIRALEPAAADAAAGQVAPAAAVESTEADTPGGDAPTPEGGTPAPAQPPAVTDAPSPPADREDPVF